MKKIFTIVAVFLMVFSIKAQKKNAKVTLEVDGVCMMCKKRIEKAALNTKGVKFANWDVESHWLTVIMDERKTSKTMVCENLAKAGHDTKEIKATKEDYDNLHPCCRYRDEEIIEDHNKKDK
ncbi:copper chaperone CopZ [Tenacibaculum adriaticum]|uniref:Copper chaperone CopZ n=1 Tax=Tenacibaculum adriaticum TaxID=413713 RepID=A0A5S5DT61_9FLAO|nr:cation transporter [Tenacibaculum adriaticum]TYP97849.1 copper chaperone CopZ [Tenacibaculum adriaticum]